MKPEMTPIAMLREALVILLSQVDYAAPARACAPWQPICEVLPQEVIKIARQAIDAAEDAELNRKLRASLSQGRKA